MQLENIMQAYLQNPIPVRVAPKIQSYVWGQPASDSFIFRFLQKQVDDSNRNRHIAELWFGAHRKNPGRVSLGSEKVAMDVFAGMGGQALLGPGRKEIGQLFKVLDAREALSLQMHERYKPDSKNECWLVVIDRERLEKYGPDRMIAEIYLGFRPVEEMEENHIPGFRAAYQAQATMSGKKAYFKKRYAEALERGKTDKAGLEIKAFHNKIEVRWEQRSVELYLNGKKQSEATKQRLGIDRNILVMNVPGATVHTLAYGVIYELQETADKTLRLYDHGRNDPKRPLHIEESLAKLDFTLRPARDFLLEPAALSDKLINLIRTPLYAMDLLQLGGNESEQIQIGASYQMLVVTRGSGTLVYSDQQRKEQTLLLNKGDMLMLPAALRQVTFTTTRQLEVLKAYEATPEEIAEVQRLRGKQHFWELPGFFDKNTHTRSN